MKITITTFHALDPEDIAQTEESIKSMMGYGSKGVGKKGVIIAAAAAAALAVIPAVILLHGGSTDDSDKVKSAPETVSVVSSDTLEEDISSAFVSAQSSEVSSKEESSEVSSKAVSSKAVSSKAVSSKAVSSKNTSSKNTLSKSASSKKTSSKSTSSKSTSSTKSEVKKSGDTSANSTASEVTVIYYQEQPEEGGGNDAGYDEEAERAERERIASQKAESQRIASQKAESQRIASERAESQRLESERIASEKAESERAASEAADYQAGYPNRGVGDVVTFGAYDWYIIAKTDNRVTLLCKDIVDYRQYNDEIVDITWENCTLRKWLNNVFYRRFTDEEKSYIAKTKCENKDNSEYGTDGGNDTEDYVFLLSLDEAEALDETIRAGSWWLRSPGALQYFAADVNFYGLWRYGDRVTCGNDVRPALNLEF